MMKSRSRPAKAQRPAARSKNLVVQIDNSQRRKVDLKRLRAAVQAVLAGEGVRRANISLAIVDDRSIHDLNRRFLKHDEPTDVISFLLDQADGIVDGQIVISADTAAASAKRYGWNAAAELLLYAVHGALHLVGYDDHTARAQRAMRQRECHYLAQFGFSPQYEKFPPRAKKAQR